jgi:hypothetical protein
MNIHRILSDSTTARQELIHSFFFENLISFILNPLGGSLIKRLNAEEPLIFGFPIDPEYTFPRR